MTRDERKRRSAERALRDEREYRDEQVLRELNERFSIASGPVLLRSAKAIMATQKQQEKQEKPRKNTAWERKSYERLPANQLPESVKGCKT